MNFTTSRILESKTCPGVRVVCKTFSHGRRSALMLDLAEYSQQLAEIYAEMQDSQIDHGEIAGEACEKCGHATEARAGDPPEVRNRKMAKLASLRSKEEALTTKHFKAAHIRHYVSRIEGLEIEGEPATPELQLAEGPVELTDEIYDFIMANCGLPPGESKNSPSPLTSPGAADGKTSDTVADSAGTKGSTETATAASSTPSE